MAPPPSPPLEDEKRRLRQEMAARRAGLSQAEREAGARAAAERLLALPALEAARARAARRGEAPRLSGFVAFRGELDPAAALEAARASGFVVALPRIASVRPPRLEFCEASGVDALADGPHGLREPLPACPVVDVEALDVMLVPGLAFDAAGRRLGMGGGYYDEAGRQLRGRGEEALGVMIGFAYDFQVVDACPADARDVAVDLVVTERRVLTAGARP